MNYQQRLQKLMRFYRNNHYIPGYGELARLFGLKSKGSLYKYIRKFLEDGILEKNNQGRLVPTTKLFGLKVLGTVEAGFPSPAEEELADTMSLDEYLVKNPTATYLLKVSGDSMKDAGIVKDDIAVVDSSITPKINDIVIAEVDQEWTMKYFQKKGNKVWLRAGNKKYEDIYPENELRIAGVVVSVIRKYR